jgi:hypothetical protein
MSAIRSIDAGAIRDGEHLSRLLRALLIELLEDDGDAEVVRARDIYPPDRPESHNRRNVFISSGGGPVWRIVAIDEDSPPAAVIDLARRIGIAEARDALKVLLARQKEHREAERAEKRSEPAVEPAQPANNEE